MDVLLANSLGGLLGYACVIPLEKILPSRDRLDEQSISKGMRVSLTRRVTSTLLDLLWCNIVTMLLTGIVRYLTKKVLWYLPVYFFIYALWSWYRKGVPFGKRLTRLRLVTMDNTEVKWYQYFLRYGLLYGFLKLPEGITWMIDTWIPLSSTYQMIARVLVWIGCFLWGITCLVKVAFHESLLYERGSRTKVVSTIEKSEKE